jgi:hypothetical protein
VRGENREKNIGLGGFNDGLRLSWGTIQSEYNWIRGRDAACALREGGRVAKRDPFDRPLAEASGVGGEAAVYRDRARRLGLSFVPFVDLGSGAVADIAAIRLALDSQTKCDTGYVRGRHGNKVQSLHA